MCLGGRGKWGWRHIKKGEQGLRNSPAWNENDSFQLTLSLFVGPNLQTFIGLANLKFSSNTFGSYTNHRPGVKDKYNDKKNKRSGIFSFTTKGKWL